MAATVTFEAMVAGSPPELQEIAGRLRQLIHDLHPDVVEVVRLGERSATFGLGPKKMSAGYCYIIPHARWVNLGFFKGALLPDPSNLLEGSGKLLRHVKFASLEETDQNTIRTLIEVAIAERRAALSTVS